MSENISSQPPQPKRSDFDDNMYIVRAIFSDGTSKDITANTKSQLALDLNLPHLPKNAVIYRPTGEGDTRGESYVLDSEFGSTLRRLQRPYFSKQKKEESTPLAIPTPAPNTTPIKKVRYDIPVLKGRSLIFKEKEIHFSGKELTLVGNMNAYTIIQSRNIAESIENSSPVAILPSMIIEYGKKVGAIFVATDKASKSRRRLYFFKLNQPSDETERLVKQNSLEVLAQSIE
ncbi:MAG: hypothetical protein AABX66_01960 [Nanoarchaeota archaeon]